MDGVVKKISNLLQEVFLDLQVICIYHLFFRATNHCFLWQPIKAQLNGIIKFAAITYRF